MIIKIDDTSYINDYYIGIASILECTDNKTRWNVNLVCNSSKESFDKPFEVSEQDAIKLICLLSDLYGNHEGIL